MHLFVRDQSVVNASNARLRDELIFLLLLMWVGGFVEPAAAFGGQSTVFVDDSAPPGGAGFSWQAPLNNLQDVMGIAAINGLRPGPADRL